MAMGAVADWDLVATIGADGTTTLTNTGADPITIGTFGFKSEWDTITAIVAGGKFASYIGLPNGSGEIAFVTFGAPAVLAAGESTNIGVVSTPFYGAYWDQMFVDVDPEPVYYFGWISEPASMSMLGLGALALVRRRRSA